MKTNQYYFIIKVREKELGLRVKSDPFSFSNVEVTVECAIRNN